MNQLSDPLVFNGGHHVRGAEDWEARRAELFDAVVPLEYGGLPPAPIATTSRILNHHVIAALGQADHLSIRVTAQTDSVNQQTVSFMLDLLSPRGDSPRPAIITGDACWRYVTDAVVAEVLRRGYTLAQFNRVELAADMPDSRNLGGLYAAYPDASFGALAAWAWGFHRCVDVLTSMLQVDADRIAVIGHSRGGKTSLLAGATDPRIALVCANNSGAGGAGCYRFQGPGSETLADLLRQFPFWFGPDLPQYIGREQELSFDQHYLKALVAPRALITLEALGDLWANPTGTQRTHDAVKPVWQRVGTVDSLGIVYRDGGHTLGLADWEAFLDFADWRLLGKLPTRPFDHNPFELGSEPAGQSG